MRVVRIIVLLLLVVGLLYVFVRTQDLSVQVKELQRGSANVATAPYSIEHDPEDVELALFMGRLHQYTQKLHAAGEADNIELARFYQHEIEEVMEELEAERIVDEGKDISALLGIYGTPAISKLENHLESSGTSDFSNAFNALLSNCNACHVASDHAFIRVTAPATAPSGQDFSAIE